MFFYDKTPKQMLVDLINEANPQLPFPINATDYEFMDPVAITETPEGHNSEIRLFAHPTAPYFGNIVLTYRRLDLGRLFWGITPRIQKWFPGSDGTGDNGQVIATLYDILPLFSKQYGLLLDETQIQNLSMTAYYGANEGRLYTMRARTDSYIYVGSVAYNWMSGRRGLEDVVTEDETVGIYYPGGSDFTDPEQRKVYLTPVTYDRDFSLEYFNNTIDWQQTRRYYIGHYREDSNHNRFLQDVAHVFEEVLGVTPTMTHNDANDYRATPFNFSGFGIVHTSLPNGNYPEANAEFYNYVIILECPPDCPWGVGNLYFHYNR
jgi:hypothetical protein